jgi:hypothetical protein
MLKDGKKHTEGTQKGQEKGTVKKVGESQNTTEKQSL